MITMRADPDNLIHEVCGRRYADHTFVGIGDEAETICPTPADKPESAEEDTE